MRFFVVGAPNPTPNTNPNPNPNPHANQVGAPGGQQACTVLVEGVPFSGTVDSDETRCFAYELQHTDKVLALSTLTLPLTPTLTPNP